MAWTSRYSNKPQVPRTSLKADTFTLYILHLSMTMTWSLYFPLVALPSTLTSLKIHWFLNDQMDHITANQISCHNLLFLPQITGPPNCRKWHLRLDWRAEFIPHHHKHSIQTCDATVRSKNMWDSVSSLQWQILHNVCDLKTTPRCASSEVLGLCCRLLSKQKRPHSKDQYFAIGSWRIHQVLNV